MYVCLWDNMINKTKRRVSILGSGTGEPAESERQQVKPQRQACFMDGGPGPLYRPPADGPSSAERRRRRVGCFYSGRRPPDRPFRSRLPVTAGGGNPSGRQVDRRASPKQVFHTGWCTYAYIYIRSSAADGGWRSTFRFRAEIGG